jgi:hypothetical protein
MPGGDFESTLCQESRSVAAGEAEFGQPLCRDKCQQEDRRRHAALLRATQLAVEPDAIAVNSVREGKPA